MARHCHFVTIDNPEIDILWQSMESLNASHGDHLEVIHTSAKYFNHIWMVLEILDMILQVS